MAIAAWTPPSGSTWNNLDLYLRADQAGPLEVYQGDDNKTNSENALNWLGARVMGYTYLDGFSTVVNTGSSAGNASVVNASDHQVLRRSGASLGFGSIDLSQSATVGTSVLNYENGGTGLATIGTAGQLLRVNAGATGYEFFTGTALYSFENALTLSGSVVKFGGPLTGATTVTTATYDLTFAQASSRSFVVGNDGTLKAFDTTAFPRLQYSPTLYNSVAGLAINALGTSAITPSATLHVRGSNTATNFTAYFENSAAQKLFAINDEAIIAIGNANSLTMYPYQSNLPDINGTNITFDSRTTTEVASDGAFRFNGSLTFSATSGAQYVVGIKKGFAPTSGTATFAGLFLNSTINQTGGSTGITRGIYSNQVLTSAYNYQAFYFSPSAAYAPNAAVTNYYFSGIAPNINASVNNQTITGLDITLSGSDGAFTGVTRYALRLTGGSLNVANLAGTATRIPSLNSSGTFGQLSGTGVIRMTGTTVAFDATVPSTSSATAGYLPYWNSTTNLTISPIQTDGTNIGIGTATVGVRLAVMGSIRAIGTTTFNITGSQTATAGLRAGASLNYTGSFSMYSNAGTAGEGTDIAYWNGSTYRIGLRINNVASGFGNLLLMEAGGSVLIGTSTAVSPHLLYAAGSIGALDTSGFYLNSGSTMQGRWYQTGTVITEDRISPTDRVWIIGGTTRQLTLSTAGNIWHGPATSTAWDTTFRFYQMQNHGAWYSSTTVNQSFLSDNIYYNSGLKYQSNGYANRVALDSVNGAISLDVANTSTTGSTVTFNSVLKAEYNGDVTLQHTASTKFLKYLSGNSLVLTGTEAAGGSVGYTVGNSDSTGYSYYGTTLDTAGQGFLLATYNSAYAGVMGSKALVGTSMLGFVTEGLISFDPSLGLGIYDNTGGLLMEWKNGLVFQKLQVGNAGLASGNLYKDTAANILSNGDYVVGMKA